jgi:hypothetical protein
MDDAAARSDLDRSDESDATPQAPDVVSEGMETEAEATLWPMEEVAVGDDDGRQEALDEPGDDEPLDVSPDDEPQSSPTLDELVADLAEPDVSEEAGEPTVSNEEAGAEPEEPAESSDEEAEGRESFEASFAEPTIRPVAARLWVRVPFWVLGAAWAGFVGALTYLLWPVSTAAFVTHPLYRYLVYGGAGLVGLGFALGLIVWVVALIRAGRGARAGIARAVWTRALGWTAGGVALWWIGLTLLDLHRAGII